MTTLHQAYLQACLHRQLFTDDEAFTLYQRLCELHQMTASREAMYTFFGELNRSIFKFDLELRRMTDEDTGIPMWSLVNTNGDDIAQQATKYTARELKYMKKLIHMIAGADNELFSVSAITALNESPDHLSKVETEALLTSFVKDGWLTLTEGYYGLGVRCLMELASYLKERFQMPECNICMDMITKVGRFKCLWFDIYTFLG
jgi:hypothetical protein